MLRPLAIVLIFVGCSGAPDVGQWHPAAVQREWPDESGDAIPLPAELSNLAWLRNVSRYGHAGPPTDRGHSGSFGVGNGRVFALIGLDEPRNTVTGAVGPGYQAKGGFFGDSAIHLVRDGQVLTPEFEQAQRPRGTAVVRTSAQSAGARWSTIDVAPPGLDLILRHITVRADVEGPTLALRITLAREANETPPSASDALFQNRGPNQLRVDCVGGTNATSTSLDIPVPALAAGTEWSTTCWYRFRTTGDWPSTSETTAALLENSRQETAAFLKAAATLEVPDQKVLDLYEGMLITMHVQTAPNGIVSPMSRYTNGWLRDEEGPVRLFLAAGLHADARRVLDAGYRAMIARHSIANSFPLDLEVSSEEPEDPDEFWATASFMPGYAPAEAPSFVPLLTARYVDHSGDTALLTPSRLAFLTACLTRQELSPEGLLPFSRDETFRYPFATVLGGSPETLGWSANSSFLLPPAADRLVELGGPASLHDLAKRVRDRAEATYWSEARGSYAPIARTEGGVVEAPYEDVSTQPLWLSYLPPSDPKASRNLDATLAALLREDGTLLSPTAAFSTGMVPGFLLQNVTALARPEEELAFNALDVVATPSGHFEELHAPDNAAAMVVHRSDGTGGDAPARHRPWEGGNVVWAMLDFLIGARPDAIDGRLTLEPHLPNGWPSVTAGGLRLGNDAYSVEAREYREGRTLAITRAAGATPWRVTCVLHGRRNLQRLWVDGTSVTIAPASRLMLPEITLPPGATVRVVAAY